LNPHDFQRLRNPTMRKVMPPRISLGRIANMVGISQQEFIDKMNELAGLPREDANGGSAEAALPDAGKERPEWLRDVDEHSIHWVDVTPLDAKLEDPMPPINIAVNTSKPGEIVGIQHQWEPQPLYDIWSGRGFKFWSQQIEPDLWHIFVYRPQD
jgi:hypothetical protein